MRFAKQQLMHQVWLLLLDAEFMHAFEYGILVHCGDGVVRRLFPRIYTYSADYPERCVSLTDTLLSCLLISLAAYFWRACGS